MVIRTLPPLLCIEPKRFLTVTYSRKAVYMQPINSSESCGSPGDCDYGRQIRKLLVFCFDFSYQLTRMSVEGGFEAGCRISAGSVLLRIPSAEHLELPSACSGAVPRASTGFTASLSHNPNLSPSLRNKKLID